MGIFFKYRPPVITTRGTITEDENVIQQSRAEVIDTPPPGGGPQFLWGRLIFAFLLLALILAAGIYTAHDKALEEWNKILSHAFQLLLGGTAGLITGEAASHK